MSLQDSVGCVAGLNLAGRLVAEQLAMLGIGKIVLFDPDAVPVQYGFNTEEEGRDRVHVVAQRCHEINPRLDVESWSGIPERVSRFDWLFVCRIFPILSRETLAELAEQSSWLGVFYENGSTLHAETASQKSDRIVRQFFGEGPQANNQALPSQVIIAGWLVQGLIHHVRGCRKYRRLKIRDGEIEVDPA